MQRKNLPHFVRSATHRNETKMKLTNEKGQHFFFSCDWLQYSVLLKKKDPVLKCPPGMRLEWLPGNNVYKRRFILWDTFGDKWVTGLYHPYSKALNEYLMSIQIANKHLYDGTISAAIELVNLVVDCTFNSLGRVDICCDFQPTENQYDIMNGLATGGCYVQAKSEGAVWWHDAPKKGMNFGKLQHCMNWGSKKSDIKIKMYNKSREQGLLLPKVTEPEKPWIVDRWSDVDKKKMWRMEFSVNGTGKLKYNNNTLSLKEVSDEYFLARWFKDYYERRFIVRNNQGKRDGHKNTDGIMKFLSLPDIPNARTDWREPIKPYEIPDNIKLLRRLMSQVTNPSVMCNDAFFGTYANMVFECCEQFHLHNYFENHYGKPVDEFFGELQNGTGVHDVAEPKPEKFWD